MKCETEKHPAGYPFTQGIRLFSCDGSLRYYDHYMISVPTFEEEQALLNEGKKLIAGVDEVGRGPLAGPVVAAAVILDPSNLPQGLNDSKKLSEKKREELFEIICASAWVSIISLPPSTIDHLNIRAATLRAMTKAVSSLSITPHHVLIDGRDIPDDLSIPATALVKGDSRSISIAAASIIAKVTRDRQMIEADQAYPAYGFAKHKGYGSSHHRAVIQEQGPCLLHRISFNPVKSMVSSRDCLEKHI